MYSKDRMIEIQNAILSRSSVKEKGASLKDGLDFLWNAPLSLRKLFVNTLTKELARVLGGWEISQMLHGPNDIPDIIIYDENDSALIYTAKMLVCVTNVFEAIERMKSLIDFFDVQLTAPKFKGLDKKEIIDLLHLVQEKFHFIEILTCKQQLEIFIFNNSHSKFNSISEIMVSSKDISTYSRRNLLSFCPRAKDANPYQVFFHELGHMLQVTLTHNQANIPSSFIDINMPLNVRIKKDSPEAPEVFADIFSLAAMVNTKVGKENTFVTTFPQGVTSYLEFYFKILIEKAYRNMDLVKDKPFDIDKELIASICEIVC